MTKAGERLISASKEAAEIAKHSHFVEIDYTNWRGERCKRKIKPIRLVFGLSEYHKGQQWLLIAMDDKTKNTKEFAMSGIHGWKPLEEETEG